ncbi:MAG: 4Fe-4S binding protein [Sulfurimonas sp.]|jgi:ferredoxin-type protein NapF|nr:4Fe-4S binding protein [Sulfurimonadaceae bacterium]
MSQTKSKREIFNSFVSKVAPKEPKLLRPPYFNDEALFSECHKCEALCVSACEESIIYIADDKSPFLDFSKSGCTYCDKCAIACELGVLDLEYKKPIGAKIAIDKTKCLSWGHTMCFSCKDPCLENAIDFKALFMPSINQNCTSCGFCISRCPTDAIEVLL